MKHIAKYTLLICGLALASPARADDPIIMNLWPGKPPGQQKEPGRDTVSRREDGMTRITDVTLPQIYVVHPVRWSKGTSTAAVIIAPGGGFHDLGWGHEAESMANWFSKLGITAVMLKYRVPQVQSNPLGAIEDAQRAISLVRRMSKKWDIDADRIGMMGLSAGGALLEYALLNPDKRSYEPVDYTDKFSCRLDFAIFAYTTFHMYKHQSQWNITVPPDTPPSFWVVAGDDPLYQGAVMSFLALKKANASAELHVYEAGGHGFGENIIEPESRPLVGDWLDRLEAWMRYHKLLTARDD